MNDEKDKSKQKPGLNAIRPDDETRERFKEMAQSRNKSQTQMFKIILEEYASNKTDEKRANALNLKGETGMIKYHLERVNEEFSKIVNYAQDSIIQLEENNAQTEKIQNMNIDTLTKKVEELELKNSELTVSNNTFTEVKAQLEKNILEISELNNKLLEENKNLKSDVKTKDKKLAELDEAYNRLDSVSGTEIKSLQDAKKNLQNDLDTLHAKIKNLELSNNSLEDTIKKITELKQAEIGSIEGRYKLKLEELELQLKHSTENKDKEIQSIKRNIETEMNAARKEEVANYKLELASIKEKYTETLMELNSLKQKKQ